MHRDWHLEQASRPEFHQQSMPSMNVDRPSLDSRSSSWSSATNQVWTPAATLAHFRAVSWSGRYGLHENGGERRMRSTFSQSGRSTIYRSGRYPAIAGNARFGQQPGTAVVLERWCRDSRLPVFASCGDLAVRSFLFCLRVLNEQTGDKLCELRRSRLVGNFIL